MRGWILARAIFAVQMARGGGSLPRLAEGLINPLSRESMPRQLRA